MTTKQLKNNFNDELLELAEKYCQHNDKELNNCLYYIFKPFIEKILKEERQRVIEEIERLKLECDTVICDCGSELKDWDITDLINDLLKTLKK